MSRIKQNRSGEDQTPARVDPVSFYDGITRPGGGVLGNIFLSFHLSSQRREAIRGSARWISATIYANFNLSISLRERKRAGGEERPIKRHVRWAGEVPRYQRWSLREGARGRESDYGHSVWRAHQSVRGRQEEEWIHFRRHHARAKPAPAASRTLACSG